MARFPLIVESASDTDVICKVIDGGLLGERKGINLPGVALPIASLTDKDIVDLNWAVKQNADYIAPLVRATRERL